MWLAIILWTSVFRGIWLLIQNYREKWQIIRVLAVMFIFGFWSQLPQKLSLVVPSSLHVLGTQTSCLSPESSCEEFKEAPLQGCQPQECSPCGFLPESQCGKAHHAIIFYLDFQNECKNIWHALSTFATIHLVFGLWKVLPRGKFPVFILFLAWHLALKTLIVCFRQGMKNIGFIFFLLCINTQS